MNFFNNLKLSFIKTLTLAISLISMNFAISQSSDYTFSTNSTGSLTTMTSSTQLISTIGNDDVASSVFSFFPFWYMGQFYNTFSVNSNGGLRLGSTVISGSIYGTSFPVASQNIIAPYLGDLATLTSTGKVHYVITGTSPNRVLNVEWLNMEMNYASSVADGTFQCRLYEATGVIEFVYGAMKITGTGTLGGGTTVRIGIASTNTAGNVFSVNQTTYATDNTSASAITNTNSSTGTISSLNSSSNGSRRVFTFTPKQTFVILTSGNSTWTAPCGVNNITVESWGGGGGGGNSATTTSNGGQGGGGGAYAKGTHNVTPNQNYYYSIGTGGNGAPASSTTAAGDGTQTWFRSTVNTNSEPTDNTQGTLAKPGTKGLNNNTAVPTNGGTTTGSFGNVTTIAGSAGNKGYAGSGGFGGAAAGSAGGGQTIDQNIADGPNGNSPGGGGGGSNDASADKGGNGANGQIIIYYKLESSSAPTGSSATVTSGCPGYTTTLTQTGGILGSGGTWYWYSGSCGGTLVGTSTATDASLEVTVSSNTTYYVRSEGACVGGTTACSSVSVQVTAIPGCATSLSPSNGTTNISASGTTLTWSPGTGSPTGYDVYLSATQSDVTNNLSSAKILDNQNVTSVNTGTLSGSTTYYWKVVPKNCGGDATGCSVLSFTTAVPCTSPTFTTSKTDVLCFGQSTGSISVNASGGQSPYQYSKDNGSNWSSGSTFNSLLVGNYTILVKGNDDCVSSSSVVTITGPVSAITSNAGIDVTSCVGVNNTLGDSPTASGGTGTLTYSWTSTPAGFTSTSENPVVSPSSTTTYNLTVTDANGCTSQDNIVITIGSGVTKTWVGSGSGGASTDFNTASNWSPSGVPSSCDDVVINFTSGGTCLVSSNTAVKTLQISASGNITPRFGLGQNITFEVLGNTSISNSTGGSNWIDITVHNGSLFIFDGSFTTTSTANSTYIFEGYGSTNTHTTGKWRFNGDVTLGAYTVTYSSALCGGVEFDATSTQTYTHNTNNTLTMSSATGVGVKIGVNNSPTVNFTGTGTSNPTAVSLNITSNSTLSLGSKSLNASTTGGTLTLATGSTLKIGGVGSFPSGYTNHSINSTATVEYNGTTQTITSPLNSSQTYPNLIVSQSGTKTAQAALSVSGNLTINNSGALALSTFTHGITGNLTNSSTVTFGATGTLNLTGSLDNSGTITCGGSNSINVSGNWTNTGTFTPSTSTVTFNSGSGTQTISGNTTFNNLTLSSAGTRNFGSSTYTVNNSLVTSGGTMTPSTSTFIFTGSSGSISGSNAKNFYNLQINNGATITNSTGGNIFVNNNCTNNGTFNQGTGINFSMNASGGATQTMSGSGTSTFGNFLIPNSATVNVGSHNFTVGGTSFNVASATGVFNGGTGTVTFDNAVVLGSGTGTYNFNNVTINNTKSFSVNNKNISVTGNWTNNGTFTPGNATVTLTASSGTQTINNGSSSFNNLSHTGQGNASFTATTTINNDFTNTNGCIILNNNNLTITGNYSNSVGSSGFGEGLQPGTATVIFNKSTSTQTLFQEAGSDFYSITHNGNGTLLLNSNISMTGNLVNSSGTLDVNTSYNIILVGNWTNTAIFVPGNAYVATVGDLGTQSINNSSSNFQNFKHLGQSTVSLTNPSEVKGNLTVDGPISTNSTFILNGSSDQSIDSDTQSDITVGNLTINKSTGVVNLNKPVKVSNTLTMTNGNIKSTTTNILEIGTSSTNVGLVSWSNGTVDGPMKRWFATSINSTDGSGVFPIGNTISGKGLINRYAQVNFTTAPTSSGYIIAEYKLGIAETGYNGLPLNYWSGSYPQFIQDFEEEGYWEITPHNISGTPYGSLNTTPYTLKLRLNNPSTVTNGWTPNNDGNDLYDASTIRIIRAKGPSHSNWELAGTHVSVTEVGNGDYYLTSSGITGFSWFNGGGNNQNPLPVTLVSFSGTCSDDGVLLNWKTASENNSSHFDIEKSRDGSIWKKIETIEAAGNSNELINYNYIDKLEFENNNYYRLQQYDKDGVYKTYGPISISCIENSSGYFSIFPNPSDNSFNLLLNNQNLIGNCLLIISDDLGKIVYSKSIEIKGGINLINLEKIDIESGVYYISVLNDKFTSGVLKQIVR